MVVKVIAYMSLFAWPVMVMCALHWLSDGLIGLGLKEYMGCLLLYVVFGNSHLKDQTEKILNLP